MRGDSAPVRACPELLQNDGDDAVHPPDQDRFGWQGVVSIVKRKPYGVDFSGHTSTTPCAAAQGVLETRPTAYSSLEASMTALPCVAARRVDGPHRGSGSVAPRIQRGLSSLLALPALRAGELLAAAQAATLTGHAIDCSGFGGRGPVRRARRPVLDENPREGEGAPFRSKAQAAPSSAAAALLTAGARRPRARSVSIASTGAHGCAVLGTQDSQSPRARRNTATVSACSWSSGCSATSWSIAACTSLRASARAMRSTRQLRVRSASA